LPEYQFNYKKAKLNRFANRSGKSKWSNIWEDDGQRMNVAAQAKIWADRVLEMSGLLSEPIT
jgi:hypothetical protein